MVVKSSAFYLVDPNMSHKGVVTHNLAKEDDKLYQNHYMHMDPLNPALYEKGGETVVHMDSIMTPHFIKQSVYYQDFLKPLNYRYCADIFFRSDGHIVAVITLLRDESQGAFLDDELSLLRKQQPFLEFTLNTVYMPKRAAERATIEDRYHLTARELDVLELVISGASNKVIANELMLSLATVKTHLQHIYHKAGVFSRAELLSQIISDLKLIN
ncbi:MAG: response regulator transcription factor [Proteobacteria bacterium]|nr:response regulator transcription factor [Pseudomonadota bacterium]